MADGINTDKVIVNAGGSGDGGMAAVLPALIAAMNSGGGDNNLAGILAAQRGNNDLAPLMAMMNNRNDGDGMNNMWPIILLAL